MKTILFCLMMFLPFISCQKEPKKVIPPKDLSPTASRSVLFDTLPTPKLKPNEYILGNDTIRVTKPYIYSFEGNIDGKKIQLHLYNATSGEAFSASPKATIYIQNEDFYGTNFEENKDLSSFDRILPDSTVINTKVELIDIETQNRKIKIYYKNKTINLYESNYFPKYNV